MRPGWYPDPTGDPAWRWFDGSHWTMVAVARTGDRPPTGWPPPGQPRGPVPPAPRQSRGTGWLVLVLTLVLGAGLLLRLPPRVNEARLELPPTGPTAASGAPEPSRPASLCQRGTPSDRSFHPVDGSLYGGRLRLLRSHAPYHSGPGSITVLRSTSDAASFYQVGAAGTQAAELSLGEIRRTETYPDPETSARRLAGCLAADARLYSTPAPLSITTQRAHPVGQRPGALLVASLPPGPSGRPGLSNLVLLVVDDGRPDRWSVACATTHQSADLDRVLAAIDHVDVV
ncbi:MAG: DUF2510 domain-containing protein [Actinomycetia bacterium]|nr:DUF2510 domain-containing protein [Actinomycetes bacterium]